MMILEFSYALNDSIFHIEERNLYYRYFEYSENYQIFISGERSRISDSKRTNLFDE